MSLLRRLVIGLTVLAALALLGVIALLWAFPEQPDPCPLYDETTELARYWARDDRVALPALPSGINFDLASGHWKDGAQAFGRLRGAGNFAEGLRGALGDPVPCEMSAPPPSCTEAGAPLAFWRDIQAERCYRAGWDDGKQGEQWLFAFPRDDGADVYFVYELSRD